MAILLKVKWVDQSSQPELHRRIKHIGGDSRELRWKHSHAEAIRFIESRQFEYYIESALRSTRLDVGQTAEGRKYLVAQTDAGFSQLLLNLPQFPDVNDSSAG